MAVFRISSGYPLQQEPVPDFLISFVFKGLPFVPGLDVQGRLTYYISGKYTHTHAGLGLLTGVAALGDPLLVND